MLQVYLQESKPVLEVYTDIMVLFDTEPDLIRGFERFLPAPPTQANKNNDLSSEPRKRFASELYFVKDFASKVQARFTHQQSIYQDFIMTLHNHQLGSKTALEARVELSVLLSSEPDLVRGLALLLPGHGSQAGAHADQTLPTNIDRKRADEMAGEGRGETV